MSRLRSTSGLMRLPHRKAMASRQPQPLASSPSSMPLLRGMYTGSRLGIMVNTRRLRRHLVGGAAAHRL